MSILLVVADGVIFKDKPTCPLLEPVVEAVSLFSTESVCKTLPPIPNPVAVPEQVTFPIVVLPSAAKIILLALEEACF